MWRHRSWDVPQSPPGDVDTRYPPSRALPPSSCPRGAEVLWLALTARASGGGGKASHAFPVPRQQSPPLLPVPASGLRSTTSPAGLSEGCAGALDAAPASARGQRGSAWALGFLLLLVGAGRCVPIPARPPGIGWRSRWPAGRAPRGLRVSTSCRGRTGTCPGSPGFQPGLAPVGERRKAAIRASSFSMQKRAAHGSCRAGSAFPRCRRQASPCPRARRPPRRGRPGRWGGEAGQAARRAG